MNTNNLLIGIGAAVLIGGVAFAAYDRDSSQRPEYGQVVAVDSIKESETVATPRQVCEDRIVQPLHTERGGNGGQEIDKNHDGDRLAESIQRECHTVTDRSSIERVTGYRVTYRYDHELHTIHMDHKPGNRLPIADGMAVTNNAFDNSDG